MRSSLAIALMLAASCPIVGEAAAPSGMSEADKRVGAASHADVVRQYGGAMTGPAADMLTRVGRRVAVEARLSRTGDDFTVTLLDTPEFQALATMGGYIYATRGLLALMNDEAELAAVLGHEVGHVAKRHVRLGQQRQTMSNIFAISMRIVGGAPVGQLAGKAMVDLNLGFARGDEYVADDLGVRYLAAAGYDPAAAADAFGAMQRYQDSMARFSLRQPGEKTPKGDHPETAARVARARQEAAKTGKQGQGERNRAAYLAAIDGLAYGTKAEEGFFDGHEFKLPQQRMAFTIPPDTLVTTSERGVSITARGSQAQFSEQWLEGPFSGAPDEVLSRAGAIQRFRIQSAKINGLEVRYAAGLGETPAGRPVDIDAIVYRDPIQRRIYSITTWAPEGAGLGPFAAMVESVRSIPAGERIDLRPPRLKIVTVQPGDTIERLAAQMAVPEDGLAQFLLINGLEPGAALTPGTSVKLLQR
ncbi:M48 family metalloprotease [Rhizorhabdus dicambivorans]|uniref:Peptidase M48 Ste24p n=1 Tax=Rhizorhabdus dicambivorans TaxID=1850238 RepID=A0A2A4G2P0_9SPHN|nr:M48 family metalloprotease [Rhizorhabdus dicambivorans]ATE65015.1 peptidase M48 Ste24p [Rhizorhabdus dicambivorans]PCE44288.1 peptidase M48 Ste24p [Rhizorhabdus dicambivorans]